jgi:hypothetical protein
MNYPLEIGSTYNLNLLSPAILGSGYKNATVMGILDFDSAMIVQDVVPIHAAVYSSLPTGTPVNAKDLLYIKIKTSTNEVRVIAMDWLSSAPTKVTSVNATVVLKDVDLSKLPLLRAALQQNGFVNFDITTT